MLLDMKRLECLDGLRGLLAVYVLAGHMAPFALLPEWLQITVSHGGAAVDVFFILSGLVITQSLVHLDGRAKPFLIARAARIFPVFFVVFAIAVALQPWSCGFERMPWIGPDNAARTICVMAWPHALMPEIVAHLTMTHGLFPAAVLPDVWVSFLGSAWSLSTEWQFYLLALLVAGRSERLCWLLLVLAAAGVAWHLAVPDQWRFSRAFLPNKAHFFALGVASAPVIGRETGAFARYGVVLAMSLAICTAQGTIGKMLPPLAWTLCLGIQLQPCTLSQCLGGWLLRSKIARNLGAISYCVYLVNEPIHKLVGAPLSRLADGNSTLFTVLWIPAAIGLPLVASAWLHAKLEAPALQWGRSVAQGLMRRQAANPVQGVGRRL